MPDPSPRRQPEFPWDVPQHEWDFPLRLPLKEGDLTGPSVMIECTLESAVTEKAIAQNRFIARARWQGDEKYDWLECFEQVLCQFEPDGETLVALRKPTGEELDAMRVPVFIQEDEWPMCCDRSMHFVGQVSDDNIKDEPPPDAEMWWHDEAEFLVFTCPICLECKAIGQQF